MPAEDELYQLWCDSDDAAKPGIEPELLEIFSRHARALIWKVLQEHNEELALHIAGEALRKLAAFKGESTLSTWVHSIALNQIALELRARYRRRKNFGVPLEFAEELPDPRTQSALEAGIALEQLGSKLSPDDRRLLRAMVEGKNQREIAESLGISEHAVESKRRRLPGKVKKLSQK